MQKLINNIVNKFFKATLKVIRIVPAIIAAICSLFEILGAAQENYGSTITFAVYMILNTMAQFYSAVKTSKLLQYTLVFISLSIALQTLSFSLLLIKKRNLSASQPQNQLTLVPMLTGNNPPIYHL